MQLHFFNGNFAYIGLFLGCLKQRQRTTVDGPVLHPKPTSTSESNSRSFAATPDLEAAPRFFMADLNHHRLRQTDNENHAKVHFEDDGLGLFLHFYKNVEKLAQ